MQKHGMIKIIGNVLRNPWFIMIGMMTGIAIGIFAKPLVKSIAPAGDIYLSILQMCALPIMITAIISSLGNLFKSKKASRQIIRLIFSLAFSLIFASFFGIFIAKIGTPGKNLSLKARTELGRIITQGDTNLSSSHNNKFSLNLSDTVYLKTDISKPQETENPLLHFFTQMVPKNIFGAIMRDDYVKILFFSILVGITLGFIPLKFSKPLLVDISGFFIIFEKIMIGALYFLPFGLLCLFAEQFEKSGLAIFYILTKYMFLFYMTGILILIINSILIAYYSKKPYWYAWQSLKEALLIAFGSGRSLVAMPSALKAMDEKLKLNVNIAQLVLPISINLCAVASTFTYAFDTIFFTQIYDITIGLQGLIIILIGSIFADWSGSSLPSIAALGMLSITFIPLGMPLAPALIILAAANPLLEPIKTLINLQTNCLITIFLARKNNTKKE